ncbi:response regulator transcription factor [Actinophytocola sediminis]
MSVSTTDFLAHAGLLAQLRTAPDIDLVDDPADAEVVVTTAGAWSPDQPPASARVVLVTDDPRHPSVVAAIEHGRVARVLSRGEATTSGLLVAIMAAHDDLAGPGVRFGQHEQPTAPGDPAANRLSRREVTILRMLADGLDTAAIAPHLGYSERTVKNILHNLLVRQGLRNRAHAVAYGLRNGLI